MPKFTKTTEDFICEHCGEEVIGNGYTNHCPHCLWSKHVDNNPGDRAAKCGGLMKPAKTEYEHGQWIITHTCQICGHTKRNKTSPNDNTDTLAKIAKRREF